MVAGLADENYLAQWHKDRTRTLAVVAVFIAGLWLMAWLLWRSWKGHESDAGPSRKAKTKHRNLVVTAQELLWQCYGQGESSASILRFENIRQFLLDHPPEKRYFVSIMFQRLRIFY